MSNAFKEQWSKEGIISELITLHNPQQNGVVEKKNTSIVGVTRAMFHDQGLQLSMWVEACNTIVYLQNMSPHKILGMITPGEAFS